MITSEDDAFIRRHFNIYDHNWRFYEELLGEASLIHDTLTYCDGAGLYIAAFDLGSGRPAYSSSEVQALVTASVKQLRPSYLRFINVWGRFDDLPQTLKLADGSNLTLVEQSEYYDDMFDLIFDAHAFRDSPTRSARKRMGQARRSDLDTKVVLRNVFSHEHLGVLEAWLAKHPQVSDVHREFFFTLRAYIKRPDVFVCESRRDGRLMGFSVVGVVSEERMVLHSAFPLKESGLRVGDALFLASVEFALSKDLRWLHIGYSATKNLLRSKEEWGTMTRSPSYRDAFYSADCEMKDIVRRGRLLWRMRLSDLAKVPDPCVA